MRRIRDVLRLTYDLKLSGRQISASLGISKGSVSSYLMRAQAAAVSWPLAQQMTDTELERLLFREPTEPAPHLRPEPHWPTIDQEMRRKGVTRSLLWQEYRQEQPDGYAYSWFCEQYEAWKKKTSPTMRQRHVAGEKVFVDYAGDTIDIFDPFTGVAQPMKLFVAAMGASSYVYCQARPSESLPDWIGSHVDMFAHLAGVPALIVCDNLKAAVTNPDRYEPGINRSYQDMASHYGASVLAARPYKPRDKAKAEQSVLLVQRWVRARLRNQHFFSITELNSAIAELVDQLNARIMRGYGASRAELFASLDQPALRPLPADPYVFATWKRARVAPDYHVEVDRCFYSVPYRLIRQLVDVRTADKTVEIFFKGERIASHPKSPGRRAHVTIDEHMPSAHRRHASWTPARLIAVAQKIGPATTHLIEAIMTDRPHPEQGFRSSLGILALERRYGKERLEAACQRGATIKSRSVASIRSILKNGLDRAFLEPEPQSCLPLDHPNIRGASYFQ